MQQWSPSLRDSFDLFYLECQSRRYTRSTLGFYERRLKPFIRWCDRQSVTSIEQLSAVHIRQYLVSLQERELASHSQHAAARAIKTFLNFCVNEELIAQSPMTNVRMPRLDRKLPKTLSVDEFRRIYAACETKRDKAIVLFLLDSGARASELLALKGDDIDMRTGVVTIRSGKGQKDRPTRLGTRARKQLLRYYMVRGKPEEDEYVWLALKPAYANLGLSGLMQLMRRLRKSTAIEHCSCHTFRRTFATQCLRNGMNIYVLAKLMGHSDIDVLKQYLAIIDDDLVAAHNKYSPADRML